MRERRAVVGGIEMRWLEQGTGQPVVLVHGIPTSPELWRRVIPRIRGARVLAWEMVGYGKSMDTGAGRDISVARQADYLAAWLEHLGIDRAVLVGHDLGGGVVQILAVRRPDVAAGLVLTNAVGYDAWPVPSVKALRAASRLVERVPPSWMATLLRVSFMSRAHDDAEIASESAEIHLSRYDREGGSEALVRQVRSLDVRDTLAVAGALKALDVPATVVWGEADRFLKVRYGERLARDLGAPLVRIPGGRHFTPENHPDEVALGVTRLME